MDTPEATIYTAIHDALVAMSSPALDEVYPFDTSSIGQPLPHACVFPKVGKVIGRSDGVIRNQFTFVVRVVCVASAFDTVMETLSQIRQATQTALHGVTVQGASEFGIADGFEYSVGDQTNAAIVAVEFEYNVKYRG